MIYGRPTCKAIKARVAQIHIVIVMGTLESVVMMLTIKLASAPKPNCKAPSIDEAVPVLDENGANVSADEFGRMIPTVERNAINRPTCK